MWRLPDQKSVTHLVDNFSRAIAGILGCLLAFPGLGVCKKYPPYLGGAVFVFFGTSKQVLHRLSQLSTVFGQLSTVLWNFRGLLWF